MSEQNEYESLKSYFKYLVTLTSIFVGIITFIGASIFLYDRNSLKSQLDELKIQSVESIQKIEKLAFSESNRIQRETQKIIEKEVTKELEYIFAKENISALITNKVNEEIKLNASDLIGSEIREELSKYSKQLTESVSISDSAIRMRIGHREGMTLLEKFSKNAQFLENRIRANDLLFNIKNDYAEFHERFEEEIRKDSLNRGLKTLKIKNDSLVSMNIVEFINADKNLNNISTAIGYLNNINGTKFRPFQFKEINNWIKEK